MAWEVHESMMTPEDADKIIGTFLSPMWYFLSSREDKDEVHRLADQLRKASGRLADGQASGLSPQDAVKIIDTFLSPAWFLASSQQDKDEIHRLADELRKASGLPDGTTGEERPPDLRFSVLSDIHVQYWDAESQTKFAAALSDLNAAGSAGDALILNGDLGDGRPRDYQTLTDILAANPHPQQIFCTIGNHEFYQAYYDQDGNWNPAAFPNGESDQQSLERFLSFIRRPKVYYDSWIRNHHFIFLGSEQYRQSNPGNDEDAYLSDSQLQWLSTALSSHYVPNKAIFVFLHQPLQGTVSGSLARGVVQGGQLRSILSQYPEVILFTGHTHWELRLPHTLVRDTFTMVNSSSVYKPYNGNDQPVEGPQSEGLYVEVYGDRVSIRGRDFAAKQWIPEAQFTVRYNRS
jgi:hypothetical protein